MHQSSDRIRDHRGCPRSTAGRTAMIRSPFPGEEWTLSTNQQHVSSVRVPAEESLKVASACSCLLPTPAYQGSRRPSFAAWVFRSARGLPLMHIQLKFAQPRTLGRKVSDEFTVPLCRWHH